MQIQTSMTNEEIKNDQNKDHARQSLIVLISILLKITRLVIIMICLSYFTGLAWYVFCTYFPSPTGHDFLTVYSFSDMHTTNYSRISSLTYFAFTTLSTVGLGDFHPKQNSERIFCSFIMLFGVMLTSLLMENFSQMIQELKNFNKNYDESDRFNLFLGTMRKLNDDEPLPKNLISSIEKHLEYKWMFDRNLAISTD